MKSKQTIEAIVKNVKFSQDGKAHRKNSKAITFWVPENYKKIYEVGQASSGGALYEVLRNLVMSGLEITEKQIPKEMLDDEKNHAQSSY